LHDGQVMVSRNMSNHVDIKLCSTGVGLSG
jgi:hypothetical protein